MHRLFSEASEMRKSELKKKREHGALRMLKETRVLPSSSSTAAAMYHRCLVGGYLESENEAIAQYELSLLCVCVPTSTFLATTFLALVALTFNPKC